MAAPRLSRTETLRQALRALERLRSKTLVAGPSYTQTGKTVHLCLGMVLSAHAVFEDEIPTFDPDHFGFPFPDPLGASSDQAHPERFQYHPVIYDLVYDVNERFQSGDYLTTNLVPTMKARYKYVKSYIEQQLAKEDV